MDLHTIGFPFCMDYSVVLSIIVIPKDLAIAFIGQAELNLLMAGNAGRNIYGKREGVAVCASIHIVHVDTVRICVGFPGVKGYSHLDFFFIAQILYFDGSRNGSLLKTAVFQAN